MKTIFSFLALIAFAYLFYASSTAKQYNYTATTYMPVDRPTEKDTAIFLKTVKITPLAETPQKQTNGGVSISCEVVPNTPERRTNESEAYVYMDPNRKDYDVMKKAQTPGYFINPDVVTLRVNINNNQKRVLKLRDCAVVLIIDNIQFSLPQASITQWENTNVVSGFSSTITLNGPLISTLYSSKTINVFINDVPVSYDKAGNVTEVENFEWFFLCSPATEEFKDKILYTYVETPVYKEQCPVCKGFGELDHTQTCTRCGGDGKYVNKYDGKTYNCTRCNQTGTEHIKETCNKCMGVGSLSYPKSKLPPTDSQIKYIGRDVKVITTPPGAEVWVFRSSEGRYVNDGLSPITVPWVKSESNSYPIIIKYKGTETKVLPYSESGKSLTTIKLTISGESANVTMGSKVD